MSLPYMWDAAIGVLEDDIFKDRNTHTWAVDLNKHVLSQARLERRREPRFSMSLPVKHRINGWFETWLQNKSVNISQNGIRLVLRSAVPIGSSVELKVKLPNSRRDIRMKGLVVWQKPSPNGNDLMECGIAFQSFRKQSKKEKIIEFMSNRLCRLALQTGNEFQAYPARTRQDLIESYQLAYKEYLIKGYCQENPTQLYYNHRCMVPGSQTFVIRHDKRLIGTATLILDSPCGLPMESLFGDKIQFYRKPGRKLAEVSMLAMDRHFFGRGSFSLMNLKKLSAAFQIFKVLFDYARIVMGVTDLLITMHPRHKELYQYLSFQPFGPVRSYATVRGNPALPMRLDIPYVLMTIPWENITRVYFVDKVTSCEVLQTRYQWTLESIREFLMVKQNIWDRMDPSHQSYIRECYPERIGDEFRK